MNNIYGYLHETADVHYAIQAALLGGVLLLICGFQVRRRLAADGGVLPDEGVSLRNIIEVIVEALADLGKTTMGEEHYRTYFPLVGSIFFFILVANLMGLVPWVGGASSAMEFGAAIAIVSFAAYNLIGIKTHGWKYIYQFMGPSIIEPTIAGRRWHVRLMAPLFLPLELLLHAARVLTLTVRLTANMFADHTVVSLWIGLVPILVPAVFLGLGLIVAFLQAFVFALLTMIYIGSALEEAH
jgi:F-type H+-transporting ATPase subunit a